MHSGHKHHINILEGSYVLALWPKTRGIPEIMVCRIFVFIWPFGLPVQVVPRSQSCIGSCSMGSAVDGPGSRPDY